MKYQEKEEVLFEDDVILEDLSDKYFALKNRFRTKEIKKPFHDQSLMEAFKEVYKIELSIEETMELRSFMENDYAIWKQNKIEDETKNAEIIDLKRLVLE